MRSHHSSSFHTLSHPHTLPHTHTLSNSFPACRLTVKISENSTWQSIEFHYRPCSCSPGIRETKHYTRVWLTSMFLQHMNLQISPKLNHVIIYEGFYGCMSKSKITRYEMASRELFFAVTNSKYSRHRRNFTCWCTFTMWIYTPFNCCCSQASQLLSNLIQMTSFQTDSCGSNLTLTFTSAAFNQTYFNSFFCPDT